MLGYGLLESYKSKQTVVVLQWAAKAYPKSLNTRDSLAEALEKAGTPQAAIRDSSKAVALIENFLLARDPVHDSHATNTSRDGPPVHRLFLPGMMQLMKAEIKQHATDHSLP